MNEGKCGKMMRETTRGEIKNVIEGWREMEREEGKVDSEGGQERKRKNEGEEGGREKKVENKEGMWLKVREEREEGRKGMR